MFVWTVILSAVLVWTLQGSQRSAVERTIIEARALLERDITYRAWAAGHGGLYAPVTQDTSPNPHLADLPERDIQTPSGRNLTLINPAYMTRQVHELAATTPGTRGHITSLDPIRPGNAADPWERGALEAFQRGEEEIAELSDLNGQPHLRLMRPLITRKSCLPCRAGLCGGGHPRRD